MENNGTLSFFYLIKISIPNRIKEFLFSLNSKSYHLSWHLVCLSNCERQIPFLWIWGGNCWAFVCSLFLCFFLLVWFTEETLNLENKADILRLKSTFCGCLNKMPCVDELVKLCFRIFSNKEMISLSAHQHSVVVSIRTLKRLCQIICLFRMKNHTSMKRWPHSCKLKSCSQVARLTGPGAPEELTLFWTFPLFSWCA